MSEAGPEGFKLARSLADMARELLSRGTVEETLERIAELAVSTVPGCEHAGVLVLRDRRHVETQASTSELVRISDRAQIELGEGPCLDALWEQRTYRVDDMAAEPRWRQYGPYARELGIESMLGFQLFTVDKTLGALDLYSGTKHAFDAWSEELGWVFSSYTAVALAWAQHSEQMREAVSTRQEIGEALGILMERYGLSSQDAFEVLRRASQEHNVKLRDVARRVSESGEGPFDAARDQK